MTETTIPVSEAIEDAVDFARGAWREAWAPMAIVAIGWLLIVVGGHAQVTPSVASLSDKIGWGLQLFNLPLLGALYRQGIGGQAYRGLGPAGLQLGGVEGRLLVVNAVLGLFCLLACLPMVILSGLFFLLLRRFGGVTLGPAGHWAWWFLFSILFWAALLVWLVYMCGRLSMATPLSVERRRILPFTGWPLTEGLGRTIAAAFILAQAPTLIMVLALVAFGWVEPTDVPVGLHGSWPLLDTLGAGAIVGAVLSVVQAPVSVGLLVTFYDVLAPMEPSSAIGASEEAMATPPREEEEVELEPELEPEPETELEPEPEPDPDPPFSTVEFFSHTGRFSRGEVPWLANEPTPEPYARYLGVPTEPEPEPPVAEAEIYPHSVVDFSPRTGRFSRLFSPWLAEEAAPDIEREQAVADVRSQEAHDAEPPHPADLDGADEAAHAEP